MPNNPRFVKSLVTQSIKISLLTNGLSVFLVNEIHLKLRLATELAAIYGQRVLLEELPVSNNQILCSSYDWWINNLSLTLTPKQIILPLLPIPSMGEPINQLTVSFLKRQSKNWFREFLLPDTFHAIEKAISPLRKNSGKLLILDGRINNRKWGREILSMIQPQKEISYMLPFE